MEEILQTCVPNGSPTRLLHLKEKLTTEAMLQAAFEVICTEPVSLPRTDCKEILVYDGRDSHLQ